MRERGKERERGCEGERKKGKGDERESGREGEWERHIKITMHAHSMCKRICQDNILVTASPLFSNI